MQVKGFHKTLSGRDIVFRCQFHTCVLTDYVLVLEKSELDESFRGQSRQADHQTQANRQTN